MFEFFGTLSTIVAGWLQWVYSIVGSYGWTIIIFGILVRLITWPLQLTQMRSARAMAALAPQMEALKKKYKDDREKLSQAQMELYREAGVNPLGGCLPMLIQFPILIILYQAIQKLAENPDFAAPFLWIPSLAHPEGIPPIWPFTQFYPTIAAATYFFPILILLMLATSLIQQSMMPQTSADPQAKQMGSTMKYMGIFFTFIFIPLPSGLTLYYVTQNVVGIVLQYLFMGASGLPIPNPPWIREPKPLVISGTATVAAEASTNVSPTPSTSTNGQPAEAKPPAQAADKRRTNVRSNKKRRS